MNELEYLEDYILQYSPNEWVIKNIHNTKDIFVHKNTLKWLGGNQSLLDYLSTIILNDLKLKKNFRRVECLKVLKHIKKSIDNYGEIKPEIVVKLFDIYKFLIRSKSVDVLWSISSLLRDIYLPDDAIKWLVINYKESEHILNRLLGYPLTNNRISTWAKKVYLNNEYPERKSELLGKLIKIDFPAYVKNEDDNCLLWAIFKSNIKLNKKINLLIKYSSIEAMDSVIIISNRLNTPDIAKGLLKKLNN